MSSIASSSRQTRRSRIPLMPLHAPPFLPSLASSSSSTFPSPVSLPSKRGPSTLSEPSSPGINKARKVSRTEVDGTETIRKTRIIRGKGKSREQDNDDEEQDITMELEQVEVGVTPRIKNVLERDDLGTGKSPARRLFGGLNSKEKESPISGISGAISTPPKLHRGLAPSPPVSDSPSAASSSKSPFLVTSEIEIDVQAAPSPEPESSSSFDVESDCGFTIYQSTSDEFRELDEYAASHILSGGQQQNISRSSSPSQSLSEIDTNLDNQENIMPLSISYPPSPKSKSRSNRSTPSKYSSSTSTADDEVISMYLSAPSYSSSSTSGSGTRRRERSKLVNELLLLRGETMVEKDKGDDEMEIDQEEELTPGKTLISGGRDRLRREVTMV